MKVSNSILLDLIQGGKTVNAIIKDPLACEPINSHHRTGLLARKNKIASLAIKTYARFGDVFQAQFSSPTKKCSFRSTEGLSVMLIDGTPVTDFVEATPEYVINNEEIVSANEIHVGNTPVDPIALFGGFAPKFNKQVKIAVIEAHDHSGSMVDIRIPFVKAVNAERESLRAISKENPTQEYSSTIVQFSYDTTVRTARYDTPLAELPNLDPNTFMFNGGLTALFDGIGKCIEHSDTITADKYLIIITTDGAENDSSKYSENKIRTRIEELTTLGTHTFVYCGPKNSRSQRFAKSIGINPTNIRLFDQNAKSVEALSKARTSAYTSYAAKVTKGEDTRFGFFDEN